MRRASLEPNRVTIVMQAREVLETYHAHPPVGRFPFRRLVGVYGAGAFHDQDERYAEGIRRLNTTRPRRILPDAMSADCPEHHRSCGTASRTKSPARAGLKSRRNVGSSEPTGPQFAAKGVGIRTAPAYVGKRTDGEIGRT